MTEGEVFEVHIEKIVSRGLGLGFYKDTAVFIPFTAPGDHLRATVTKQCRNHLFARCLERLVSGPERTDPGCALFTHCGGCQLRHVTEAFQRQAKEMFLKETLERFPNLRGLNAVQPVREAGPGDGYRRRAGFKVRWVGTNLLLGFFQSASHHIADIPTQCPVLEERLNGLMAPLRTLIASLSLKQKLPQVDVVAGDTGVGLICHVLAQPSRQDIKPLMHFAKEHNIAQLWVQKGRKTGMRPLVSREELFYTVENDALAFHPGDFIQAHGAGNHLLVKEAIQQAGEGEVAWDLFCGVGNFTLPLAKRFSRVLGVESHAPTLERAAINARQAPSGTISFTCLDLFKQTGIERLKTEKPADLVLLDPPREGALLLIKWLTGTLVKRMVYVSCNPATFARDAAILVHGGFQLTKVQPIDLFPHTSHVELVALFVRSSE